MVSLKEAEKKVKVMAGIKEEDYLFEEFGKLTNYIYVAEEFRKTQPFYYDNTCTFWIWNFNKTCWEKVDEIDMFNLLDKNTKYPSTSGGVKSEVLEAFKRIGRKYKLQQHKDSWVQFKDTIYDIDTNEVLKADPIYFITNPIDIEVGLTEDTPVIDKLFEDWVGIEHKQELYEILAFSLVPSYFIDRLFCLIGAGANGKSTYLNLLIKFLGVENTTSTSLYLLLGQRFEASKLHKRLVCLIGETNFNLLNNTDFLKKLTGKDLIRAEFKGKNSFDFYNYAKLIMATNSLPPTADKTEGFYRRWKIIEFPNQFKKEQDVLGKIPEIEYKNLAFKCLKIVKQLWVERQFTNDGTFEDRKKCYEDKSNPIVSFIKDNYERDVNGEITFSDFFDEFKEYLSSRGLRDLSASFVAKLLKNECFEVKKTTIDKVTTTRIYGLRPINTPNTSNTPTLHSSPICISLVESTGIQGIQGILNKVIPKQENSLEVIPKLIETSLKDLSSLESWFDEEVKKLKEEGVKNG